MAGQDGPADSAEQVRRVRDGSALGEVFAG
jgi:hypothetical protein